jgi:two-component sensor histidine kinase
MDLEKVLLGDYLSELGKHLIDHLSEQPIAFKCFSDEISIGTKISVPCGLILNELITNSLKHAFAENNSPLIILNIKIDNEQISISYKDNGPGLPDNYEEKTSSSLGINILKQSVLQLGGEYYLGNDNGFIFRMKCKM